MKDFTDKRVGLIGAGFEHIPLAKWLVRQGAKVVVADEKRKEELATFGELQDLPVEFRLGPHYLDHITDLDILFKTPGAWTATKKKIAEAAKRGVAVMTQTQLFFDLCPAPIIGVTGTNGKGTTASLIYHMLKAAEKKVLLGGNIGNAPISFIEDTSPDHWVVLELSSFQLEDLQRSPHIAVVLNITPDHLDRHKTFLEYLEAKKQIVKHQTKRDFAVLVADYMTTMECAVETPAEVHLVSAKKVVQRGAYAKGEAVFLAEDSQDQLGVKLSETRLVGRHNLENIGAAAVAARLAGAEIASIRKGAKQFKGLPHRLQYVGSYRGVLFYDDSYATTPAPAIAAIKSFQKPITLLLGGSSKKSDFRELGRTIAKESTVKHVVLLGNVEGPRIRAAIEGEMRNKQSTPDFYPVMSMEAAVETAVKLAKPGDVVLLSPAAASFDLFTNYKERGEKFVQAVKRYGS